MWKNQWEWLKVKNGKLVCSICTKYKEKLSRFSAATNAFINGSDNYRMSPLKDHSISKIHQQAYVKMKYKKEKTEVRNILQSQGKVAYPNPLLACKVSIE